MQLILDTEPSIDIKRNMSTLNEETLAEKLDIIEDLKSGLCNGNKENIQSQENMISSGEEPKSDSEKIEVAIAAKSPIHEENVDAASESLIPDENTVTTSESPECDGRAETDIKSSNPDDISVVALKSPKPDESYATENVIPDEKKSVNENVAYIESERKREDVNTDDLVSATDNTSTEDISLRMEEDSPAVIDDVTNNEEESDPIIITHNETSCSNGQEEKTETDEFVTENTVDMNVEINKESEVNKKVDVCNEDISGEQVEKVDEKIEVVDQVHEVAVQIAKEDATCLKEMKKEDGEQNEINENLESVNSLTDETLEQVVNGTCSDEKQQNVPKKVDIDEVKMEEIVKNDIQRPSLHDIITEANNEHTPNSCDSQNTEKVVKEKTNSEIDANVMNMSDGVPKDIETVDLDYGDKKTENTEKFTEIVNADSQLTAQNTIEKTLVNDNVEDSVAAMETVDLINEKDTSGLESMDVDVNGDTEEPEEKPISLSSEKDDIFDIDEVISTEETLMDNTENDKLTGKITPMDEDVQPVDEKNSPNSLDIEKEETINIQDDEVKEQEKKNEEPTKEIPQTPSQLGEATDESKPVPSVLKLSNTLNILSDDEDEMTQPQKTELMPQNKEVESATDNKCINIEDDDDIMLIDEDNTKEKKSELVKPDSQSTEIDPIGDVPESEKKLDVEPTETLPENAEKTTESPIEKSPTQCEKPEDKKDENISEAKTEVMKPLVPTNFLKTCKKNMAEMTRDDLEEFCILKIVESVVDRSSLNEIKSKLKSMAQCFEEYKKKAQLLQKQNRDLQVVLKTIQQEQKNSKTVTPLKITRSVGMQILMTERSTIRRKPPGPGSNSNITTPTKAPSPRTPNQRPIKVPAASPQPIPVPRLVPASSPTIKNNMPQINATASKATSPINGVRNTVQKAEKRGINRNHSVTVDLTDDEPPAKIMNRNSTPTPLRVVPPHMVPQNLLAATPRHPITQNNNPRKVYIPISGPQNQNIRGGQAIMLKSVTAPSPSPRPRGPQPHMTRMPQNQVRMPRVQNRHPAPLPESTKQYPGTYLKALPPAPDLKLSKVENGIVISWKIEGYQEDSYEEIASYQLYAYQETNSPPSTALWKKIGDVKALPLPMACTLTQFMAGFKYYFAVRAVDIRSRIGPFSLPGSILLLNKL